MIAQVTTHAPGPWSVLDNREMNGAYWIEAQHSDGYPVSIAEVRQGCAEADELGSVEANYRLIAAAPDLLAALRGLMDAICDTGLHNSQYPGAAMELANAAIAKAESRS